MANNKPKKITRKEAIQKILAESSEPLTYQEIAERIEAQNLLEPSEYTPVLQKVHTALGGSIKEQGEKSPFQKIDGNRFTLSDNVLPKISKVSKAANYQEKDTKQGTSSIISSFGVYWKKDGVDWTGAPQLWGKLNKRQGRADPVKVDFGPQQGVYILHNDAKITYIGRVMEGTLGGRLLDHTRGERLGHRWNKFSWFGLAPVKGDSIQKLSEAFDAKEVISAIEAVLIEVIEPGQNLKRGDKLGLSEYLQVAYKKNKRRKFVMVEEDE